MLAPPADLTDADVAAALWEHYAVDAVSLSYLAVGFGSHHWVAGDTSGGRWFVTVDDCEGKRLAPVETADGFYGRLRGAFSTALAMRGQGLGFVVAPVETVDGEALARISHAYAISLFPRLDGQALGLGEYTDDGERAQVLDLLTALHGADPTAARLIGVEDFALAHRDGLEAALAAPGGRWDAGPFSEPARTLLARHADGVRLLLAHHDGEVDRARDLPMVVTHGEPHRGNVLRVGAGLMLVDWDTALLAPAERDLWMVANDGGAAARRYQEACGRPVRPWMLDLYACAGI